MKRLYPSECLAAVLATFVPITLAYLLVGYDFCCALTARVLSLVCAWYSNSYHFHGASHSHSCQVVKLLKGKIEALEAKLEKQRAAIAAADEVASKATKAAGDHARGWNLQLDALRVHARLCMLPALAACSD